MPRATGATTLADVPAGSVGVLFLDAADDGRALPWPLLRRTLAKDAVVVSLSPFDGTARPRGGRARSGARSPRGLGRGPAHGRRVGRELRALRSRAAGAAGRDGHRRLPARPRRPRCRSRSERRRTRRGSGRAWRRSAAPTGAGSWRARRRDTPSRRRPTRAPSGRPSWPAAAGSTTGRGRRRSRSARRCRRRPRSSAWSQPEAAPNGLRLVATAARGAAGTTPASPLLSKLYQESDLRPAATTAAMSPGTAEQLGSRRPPARADREPERRRPRRAADRPDAAAGTDRARRRARPGRAALRRRA